MFIARDITFSIVSHGHREYIDLLLNDISKMENSSECKFIITNNAGENFNNFNDHKLNLSFINNKKSLGFGANHNQAFKQCRTKIFIVLNPDVRLKLFFLELLLKQLNKNRELNIASSIIFSPDGIVDDNLRENLTPLSLFKRHVIKKQESSDKNNGFIWFSGCLQIFDSITFGKLGGYNERFFMYCEDYDICARAYCDGYKLDILSDIGVIHHAQRQSRRSLSLFFLI